MGDDEKAAGGAAGIIGADTSVDVAGVERNIGVLGEPGLLGRTEATSKASRAGLGCSLGENRGGDENEDGKLESE